MRHRLATLATALTVVLGVTAAVASGPAQANALGTRSGTGPVHVAPHVQVTCGLGSNCGPFRFFLNGYNLCIVTQGVGNQIAIKDPAGNYCARLTLVWIGMGFSNQVYLLRDGNGNCLRANSSSQVKVESGCNSGDGNEPWEVANCSSGSGGACNFPGTAQWFNDGRQAYMKTNGGVNGYLVYVGFGGYNTWYLQT